jgi:3-oxoacyl-[acyl-carrier protein] reductase
MLTGRNEEKGQRLADEMTTEGASVRFVAADVGDDDAVHALVGETVAAFGSIDILVNNAGPTESALIADFFGADANDFETIMRVGVSSAYYGSRHAIPHLLQRGGGSIVNISSTAGVRHG